MAIVTDGWYRSNPWPVPVPEPNPPFRPTCSTSLQRVTWLLLLMPGIKAIPGQYWNQLRLGVFNTGGGT